MKISGHVLSIKSVTNRYSHKNPLDEASNLTNNSSTSSETLNIYLICVNLLVKWVLSYINNTDKQVSECLKVVSLINIGSEILH